MLINNSKCVFFFVFGDDEWIWIFFLIFQFYDQFNQVQCAWWKKNQMPIFDVLHVNDDVHVWMHRFLDTELIVITSNNHMVNILPIGWYCLPKKLTHKSHTSSHMRNYTNCLQSESHIMRSLYKSFMCFSRLENNEKSETKHTHHMHTHICSRPSALNSTLKY